MAIEWIKVCKDTPRKPELKLAAKLTNRSRGDAFLLWFELYCWADSQTPNGFLPHMTIDDVADMSGVPLEFCIAMSADGVRWMFPTESTATRPAGIQFAKWERHNGKCAKKRALTGRRVDRARSNGKL